MISIAENIAPLVKAYNFEIILGLCALFLMYVIATAMKESRNKLPPGPMGLPLLGYLPFLTKDPHLDFMKLGKKYGDVFSLKLGSKYVVILNGTDAILEVLKKPEFLGKPPEKEFTRIKAHSAFFGCDYQLWKEQRSSLVKIIKHLGFCNSKMEDDIVDEINDLLEVLTRNAAQPIDIKNLFFSSLSNNIYSIVFGKRFKYDDPTRRLLDENLEKMLDGFNHISLDTFLPWIRYIPFTSKFQQCKEAKTAYISNVHSVKKEIVEHLKSFNPDDLRDFIDRYLVEIDERKVENPDTSFNHDILLNNVIDLCLAGTETIVTSSLWLIYIFAAFPDVQKKVQNEIIEVIGPDKRVEFMDIRNMPYTHAVILEGMRWKAAFPLNVKRCALADIKLGDYNLKKGTIIILNFWAIHYDRRNWEEPNKFKPERFLSKDGESVVKPRFFIPFSDGRRRCPGEPMAYMQLFLYLTSILREFDVVFPNGMEPTFKGKLHLTYRPEPYLVRFIPKNNCSNE